MRKLLLLGLILSVGLSVSACDVQTSANGEFSFDIAQGKATDTWSRTYTVPAGGRFELINVNGRITAEPTDGQEVIVEGRRSAKARSDEAAKEMLAKLEIREEVGGSTVRVESRPPRMSGFGGHEIRTTGSDCFGQKHSSHDPRFRGCGWQIDLRFDGERNGSRRTVLLRGLACQVR